MSFSSFGVMHGALPMIVTEIAVVTTIIRLQRQIVNPRRIVAAEGRMRVPIVDGNGRCWTREGVKVAGVATGTG